MVWRSTFFARPSGAIIYPHPPFGVELLTEQSDIFTRVLFAIKRWRFRAFGEIAYANSFGASSFAGSGSFDITLDLDSSNIQFTEQGFDFNQSNPALPFNNKMFIGFSDVPHTVVGSITRVFSPSPYPTDGKTSPQINDITLEQVDIYFCDDIRQVPGRGYYCPFVVGLTLNWPSYTNEIGGAIFISSDVPGPFVYAGQLKIKAPGRSGEVSTSRDMRLLVSGGLATVGNITATMEPLSAFSWGGKLNTTTGAILR